MIARSSPSGPSMGLLVDGDNLTRNASDRLSPLTRPRRFFDWDYFISGGLVSSQIGRMGWSLNGVGTPSFARANGRLSSVTHGLLITSGALNDRSSLTLGNLEARLAYNPNEGFINQVVWAMNGSLANKSAFFGWNSNFAINPVNASTTALGFAYDSSVSPNYLIVYRVGTTIIDIRDTSVPVLASDPTMLSIVLPQTSEVLFDFYLSIPNGGGFETVHAGQVEIAAGFNANHGFRLQTLAASPASIDIGYWGMTSDLILNIYAGDEFLENAELGPNT